MSTIEQKSQNATKVDSTRERILSAAGRLFAKRGPEQTTLREITTAARCNLAAVNYHFRSKDALVAAAVEQAVLPIVAARYKALAQVHQMNGAKPGVEALSIALVEPLYELGQGNHRNAMLLLLRLRPDPSRSYSKIVSRLYKPLHEEFVDALEQALPHLSRAEIALRYDCARGAILQTLVELAPAKQLALDVAGQRKLSSQHQAMKAALVAFVRSGFEAAAALGK
jgi:AcrR family transcriptional regulator